MKLSRLTAMVLLAGYVQLHNQAVYAQANASVRSAVNDTMHSPGATGKRVVIKGLDTVKPGPFQPNPKKAGLFSAIVPGLGQVYNRQYWKVPIVYAGLGAAAYLFVTNLNEYQTYRKAYIGRINNSYPTDEFVGVYSQDQLRQLQDDYNSDLNMTVLYTGLGFALQVIDAVTSAHLKNFDMSRDISFRPVVTPQGVGMGLVMKL